MPLTVRVGMRHGGGSPSVGTEVPLVTGVEPGKRTRIGTARVTEDLGDGTVLAEATLDHVALPGYHIDEAELVQSVGFTPGEAPVEARVTHVTLIGDRVVDTELDRAIHGQKMLEGYREAEALRGPPVEAATLPRPASRPVQRFRNRLRRAWRMLRTGL